MHRRHCGGCKAPGNNTPPYQRGFSLPFGGLLALSFIVVPASGQTPSVEAKTGLKTLVPFNAKAYLCGMGLISKQAQRCSNKGMFTVMANGLAALDKAEEVQYGTLPPREELSLCKAIGDASEGIVKLMNTLTVVANKANGTNYEQGIRAVGAIVDATQRLQRVMGRVKGNDNTNTNTNTTNNKLKGDVSFDSYWCIVNDGQRYVSNSKAAGATIWDNADLCYITTLLHDTAGVANVLKGQMKHLDKAAAAFGYLMRELDYAIR